MFSRVMTVRAIGVLVLAGAVSGAWAGEPGGLLTVQSSGGVDPGDGARSQRAMGTAAGSAGEDAPAFDDELLAFSEGSWTVQTYGSAAIGDTDKGEMYSGHLEVGYFFRDDVSINLGAFGGVVEPTGEEGGGVGGFDLLGRWHFLRREGWSLYADSGAGLQQATVDFPSDSRFNFRLEAGLGATWRIAGDAHVMGGVRYLHISNAGITEGNDGYDGAQLYAGLMFPF